METRGLAMVLCIINIIFRVDRLCGSHKGKFIFSEVRVKKLCYMEAIGQRAI